MCCFLLLKCIVLFVTLFYGQNAYYGGNGASLSFSEFVKWCEKQRGECGKKFGATSVFKTLGIYSCEGHSRDPESALPQSSKLCHPACFSYEYHACEAEDRGNGSFPCQSELSPVFFSARLSGAACSVSYFWS